jgi:SAM-dependent methyltransferase
VKTIFNRCLSISRFALFRLGRGEKRLYAGDISHPDFHRKCLGLSLKKRDWRHIRCDVTETLPFRSNSIDVFQSEDVFEHISYEKLPAVILEIYRVLKPGGVFRLSVPDYRSQILKDRTHFDGQGNPIFDPGGGGFFRGGKIGGGGHVWFPRIESVIGLFEGIGFSKIEPLHYHDESGNPHLEKIDYQLGHVLRTPDFDERAKRLGAPLSIVVDATK